MMRLNITVCLATVLSLCLTVSACGQSHASASPYRLRGPHLSGISDLPWATQQAVNKTLEALSSGQDILLSNITWNLHTNWTRSSDEKLRILDTQQTLGQRGQQQASVLTQAVSTAIVHSIKAAFSSKSLADASLGSHAEAQAERQPTNLPPGRENGSESDVAQPVPGVVAVLYEEFFNRGSEVAVRLLKDNFKKVQLETASATAHIPVVGDFNIKLENVRLTELDVDDTSTGVSLGEDGTFVLLVSKLAAGVEGHLQWRRTKFPFISGGCEVKVTAEDGTIQLRVGVLDDGAGRPSISSLQAPDLDFGNIDIQTSDAKLAWLYNAVATLAHDQIQAAIIREVSKQVESTAPDQINKLLRGVPTTVKVKGLQLNTSLVQDPEVSPDRLIVRDWGRFKNPMNVPEECPFVRASELAGAPIMPGGSPYMLIANLDESIANCLTWDLFRQGKLGRFLIGDDVPQQALYTDTWRFVIPEVYIRCPGCPMALNATVTSAPETSFDPQLGVITLGTAELSFFMAEKQESVPWTPLVSTQRRDLRNDGEAAELGEHLFTLSLSGQLTVKDLRLEPDLPERPGGWRLNLEMKLNETALAVDVVESDVGPINKAALHVALTVAAFLVEDEVNKGILKDGFPLPDIPHIKVDRANVTVAQSAIALGTDVSYAD